MTLEEKLKATEKLLFKKRMPPRKKNFNDHGFGTEEAVINIYYDIVYQEYVVEHKRKIPIKMSIIAELHKIGNVQ